LIRDHRALRGLSLFALLVSALPGEIIAAQESEISRMKAWLKAWYQFDVSRDPASSAATPLR
jgi:uncharacterized protein (DUF305 family)